MADTMKKCFATQKRCNTSEIHNTGRPQQVNPQVKEEEDLGDEDVQSEGTSNELNILKNHEVVDDLQEREVTLNVLRSLNEEQVATSNAIKLTSDKMKALMEQLVKTSSMINTVLVKLVKTDAHGDKTNDHPKLAVKPHDTSKERDGEVFGMIPDLWDDYDPDCDLLDCKVW